MPKNRMVDYIETLRSELTSMSDGIFDHPEIAFEEFRTSGVICDFLEKYGFRVERGVAGLETAFRAEYKNGEGGPVIGLICEYDALPVMGHACAHHAEGPCVGAAAVALKNCMDSHPYTIVVYGSPAEEIGAGKVIMLSQGFFKELDVILALHLDTRTSVDVKSMALQKFVVTYHGISAHSAIKPEEGRSALDALLLSFQGIEFLREHCIEDVRMHYTILDAGGPPNVVPEKAAGEYLLRSYNSTYLQESVVKRFKKIIEGAALMTDCTYDIELERDLKGRIPVYKLNEVIMENARFVDAPQISEPRMKTGSNDAGNVMNEIPGACLRIAFLPFHSAAPHSKEFLDAGKTKAAHEAIIKCAQILACTSYDLIVDSSLVNEIQNEFQKNKESEANMYPEK